MTRKIIYGALAVMGVAGIGIAPSACSEGGVGDPCIPEDEYNPTFAGFKVTEENIESRSFQCETRICLVNHFQGRVSCPYGQGQPIACTAGDNSPCGDGTCVESATLAPDCKTNDQCGQFAGVCNSAGFCECDPANADSCPAGFQCDGAIRQCKSYVCHTPGNCQTTDKENSQPDQACCIPGTDTPVATSVCGQCDSDGGRDAANAVYCSCRCGVADGEEEDENFNFCECPDGFSCEEVRRNVGLGDEQITGKYCVLNGTDTDPTSAANRCGQVEGQYSTTQCEGTASLPSGS